MMQNFEKKSQYDSASLSQPLVGGAKATSNIPPKSIKTPQVVAIVLAHCLCVSSLATTIAW